MIAMSERDVVAAFDHNLLVPVASFLLVAAWVSWTARSFGRHVPHPLASSRASVTMLVVVTTFWVLRLLPFAPFEMLGSDRRLG